MQSREGYWSMNEPRGTSCKPLRNLTNLHKIWVHPRRKRFWSHRRASGLSNSTRSLQDLLPSKSVSSLSNDRWLNFHPGMAKLFTNKALINRERKKTYYLYADKTIAYDSGDFVSPESNELLYAWKEIRVTLQKSSHDPRKISHVEDVVKLGRRRQQLFPDCLNSVILL